MKTELIRKQITFGLSQDELKKHYGKNYEDAYRDLENFFVKNNWSKLKGSVSMYTSNSEISHCDVIGITKEAYRKLPWLLKSVEDVGVVDILSQKTIYLSDLRKKDFWTMLSL